MLEPNTIIVIEELDKNKILKKEFFSMLINLKSKRKVTEFLSMETILRILSVKAIYVIALESLSVVFKKNILMSGILVFCFGVLSVGCGKKSKNKTDDDVLPKEADQILEPVDSGPFLNLYQQGLDRYLGAYHPSESKKEKNGVIKHIFNNDVQEEGPLCFEGGQFNMSTRDGSNNKLVIFLQGGGFCGPEKCEAINYTIPLIPFGLLAKDGSSPVSDWNLGYVPYCDGSLFVGDSDADSDGDGVNDRYFRGIQNLSAALDVIRKAYPNPESILLAGNSAGGMGTLFALPLIRRVYRDVQIDIVNDSGMGIFSENSAEKILDYWSSWDFLPNCDSCILDENGNLTGYLRYQLNEDENIRVGHISSKRDEIITEAGIDAQNFETELIQASQALQTEFPERYESLIAKGDEHTFILKQFTYSIGNTTVKKWVTDMLDNSEKWQSIEE